MAKDADLTIDMDKHCSKCGEPGTAPNGLCLKCIAKRIGGGGMDDSVKFRAVLTNVKGKATHTATHTIVSHAITVETENITAEESAILNSLQHEDLGVVVTIKANQRPLAFGEDARSGKGSGTVNAGKRLAMVPGKR